MTWISLICLFALAGSAFGRSAFSYGSSVPSTQFENVAPMRDLPGPSMTSFSSGAPVQSGYGSSFVAQQDLPEKTSSSNYGSYSAPQTFTQPKMVQTERRLFDSQPIRSGYGAEIRQFEQKPLIIKEEVILSPADILCRGQRPETVIPIEESRRFVICLDESKGVIQACPIGLLYHTETRRCEKKLGPLGNPCASQPCLNGGQCTVVEHSQYQCQCAPGFDGKVCELDARVCQTKQPCGSSPDSRCQSFRLGAALEYICILQSGSAYGLDSRQVQASPCRGIDGPQPLAVSDKGFIMCDGAYMFIESCPGGTIWDDLNKACVWPDMQGTTEHVSKHTGYGSYGASISIKQLEQPRLPSSYGGQQLEQSRLTLEQPRLTSYGAQQLEQPRLPSSYGAQQLEQPRVALEQPRLPSSYGTQQLEQPRVPSSYGAQQLEQPRVSSFTQVPTQSFTQFEQPRFNSQLDLTSQTSSYGSQQTLPKPQIWQSSAMKQNDMFTAPKSNGY